MDFASSANLVEYTHIALDWDANLVDLPCKSSALFCGVDIPHMDARHMDMVRASVQSIFIAASIHVTSMAASGVAAW